jgi:hypothetical protein
MNRSALLVALLMSAALHAHAQTDTAAAAAGGKKELAQKIVQLQQPAVENMARQLVEVPAAQVLQQAGSVLQQRVAADKRQALAQEIQADARQYVESALPIVRDRALKIAPEVVGPILESKLTEDELRQVLQVMQQMDSPAFRKYNSLGPELQRALTDRLVTDTRSAVEPKVGAFRDTVARRLGVSPRSAGAPASGASAPKKP